MLSVVNHLGFTQELEKGTELGGVVPAELVDSIMTGQSVKCMAVTQGSVGVQRMSERILFK